MSKFVFDPQSVPIDEIAGEPILPLTRLTLPWIQQRFASPAIWTPEVTDEHKLRNNDAPTINAAVLIALVERTDGLQVLLTRRGEHLTHHAGQISFPGGRVEASDNGVIDTALREAHEEIGLHPNQVDVFGTLPDYVTGTGYCVTPIVGKISSDALYQSDFNEVTEVFEVPLAYLMDGTKHERRSAIFPTQQVHRSFYAMPYQNYFIWGATAGMLRNFYHFLRA